MPKLSYLKKLLSLSAGVLVISIVTSNNLYAQDGDNYLAIIAKNTTEILGKVNSLPAYLKKMTEFAVSWLSEDDSEETANMQTSFAKLGQLNQDNLNQALSIQTRIAADLLDQPANDFMQPSNSPRILRLLPNVNDLMYASMLGKPPAPKGAFAPYNYIKYAGGAALDHELPRQNWGGPDYAKARYDRYYNTVIAIESFNSYILSKLFAESKNGNQTTALQNELIRQASSSEWIAKVATEELGKVARQILLFQSQSYVVLTQLLQTQKQLLEATAMNNTLLITTNQINEAMLTAKAKGVTPRI